MMFKLAAPFAPAGDQPRAIADSCRHLCQNKKHQAVLGVTGSGKTFTVANIIARCDRPALVIAPNKTLAAQLFTELKELFPHNQIGFFISYYDYYQPEAYVVSTDTYIAKDSSINDDIDKMRHQATRALFECRDTIIVASVSCIYGLGSPENYAQLVCDLKVGQEITMKNFLASLLDIQYLRNDIDLSRGCFRVRGDIVDILPAHQDRQGVRVEFFGDEITEITLVDVLDGKQLQTLEAVTLYPNSHYVTERTMMRPLIKEIIHDLGVQLAKFKAAGKLVEFNRLEQRTMQDVETLEHLGFCPGIENYSRYLNGLPPGHPPPTLLDYFPQKFLTIIDESHITTPQIRGMFFGDRSRKQTLVNYGFRLPAALDNRPLNFDEFLEKTDQILYISATPADYELSMAQERYSELIIRPTGLVDPQIDIRPASTQVDNFAKEIFKVVANGGRLLVTTLTKKMSEDLTAHYQELGIRVRYLHADIDSLERAVLLRDLRKGEFDVLIGINLLREGLDLPEVQLVAIMDADKEGFLRSKTSLIQTVGRAARNAEARVIFYADRRTKAIDACLDETERRRVRQLRYNEQHGIVPRTVQKELPQDLREIFGLKQQTPTTILTASEIEKTLAKKTKTMRKHAATLDFEKAAQLRDEIQELRKLLLKHDLS